ncbi:GNAT family N-acetyltransferase [Pedosphaera parvula]|uniref:GCN5-related N-acetyltransferase n=1 Tax=Pedosphaera parvula (strain Ellin514) TaxID=320771 RepID=B9XCL9_PEDPL|nr:GNAT family N-acetyltransferase [Pedosphaera parvula]EEF62687.1 GCN5-related N-acetyltransferase [Pedosphaera parvula Ellin514]
MTIREMIITDYDSVMALLSSSTGVRLREADSREATARYLERNPSLSFVALVDGQLVGCVMCGHDGRRGYLQHLTVSRSYHQRGIGTALVERCLTELARLGIVKTHIDVLVENDSAIAYWSRRGWQKRDDIFRFSYLKSGNANA